MNFSRWVFRLAGIYGLVVLLPQYFLERKFGEDYPPAITHPEFYYGFLGVTVVWQLAYLLIAQDPARFRPVMLLGILAKSNFFAAAIVLYLQQRMPGAIFLAAILDLLLAALFFAAWWKIR
jgi:hypothetical protein